MTESLSENYQGNYSEGEEELLKIEDTLGNIDTSSEFFEEEKRRQKEKRDRDRARDIREALDVGEEVETKDKRWLEKYEAKLAELAAQAETEAQVAESGEDPSILAQNEDVEDESSEGDYENVDSLIEEPASLTEEFSNIMNENLVDPEIMAADHEMEALDEQVEQEASPELEAEETSSPIEGAEAFDPFSDAEDDEEPL